MYYLSRCHCPQIGPRSLLPTPMTIRRAVEFHLVHGRYHPATDGSNRSILMMPGASAAVVSYHHRRESMEGEEEVVVVEVEGAVAACVAFSNCSQMLQIDRWGHCSHRRPVLMAMRRHVQ